MEWGYTKMFYRVINTLLGPDWKDKMYCERNSLTGDQLSQKHTQKTR